MLKCLTCTILQFCVKLIDFDTSPENFLETWCNCITINKIQNYSKEIGFLHWYHKIRIWRGYETLFFRNGINDLLHARNRDPWKNEESLLSFEGYTRINLPGRSLCLRWELRRIWMRTSHKRFSFIWLLICNSASFRNLGTIGFGYRSNNNRLRCFH